jgi:hypothetical protein
MRLSAAVVHTAIATLASLVVRLSYVLSSDFPINDGGLFVVMTRELIGAGFQIPVTTSYNDLGIPFAYPPLGFYVAGVVSTVTHIDLIDLFRWLPLVLSVACVPAFALLAGELLTLTAARAATYAYALVPASFAWAIMGGGITRSFGVLFALLALAALVRALRGGSSRAALFAVVLSGLTALSHPHTAAFLALSAAAIAISRFRTRRALLQLLLVGAGGMIVAAPWWLTVVARHGITPFAAALGSSGGTSTIVPAMVTLLRWNAWNEPLFPLVSALALAGVAVSLARREMLFPLWVAAVAFLLPTPFQMISAIPLALLAGIGTAAASLIRLARRASRVAAVIGVGYLTLAAMLAFADVLVGLGADDRIAMQWIADTTPPTARVLVVTTRPLGMDNAGEWLPALGRRVSVVAPEGAEWLPGVAAQRRAQHERASACAQSDGGCLERLAADGVRFDYVYLPSLRSTQDPTADVCCAPLASALRGDARYSLVYDGGSVLIFARR